MLLYRMVKTGNQTLVENYLEHIKQEKSVSDSTIKTYNFIANSLPFSLMMTQGTIKRKLKDLYSNPNTLALYLNIIILVRRHNDEPVDRLIILRNSLKDDIIKTRKSKLDELDDVLPSMEVINEKLDELHGIDYIVNALMLRGLRNKDLNLIFVKRLPKTTRENLISIRGNKALLLVGDYKTEKSHGVKNIVISGDEGARMVKELKSLKLTDKDRLITKQNGEPIGSVSTFNDKMLGISIDKLGQNKLVKIKIRSLLKNNNFDAIEQICQDRGTSLQVLLRSYNLLNGAQSEQEQTE